MRIRYLAAVVTLAAGGLVVPLVASGLTGAASASSVEDSARHCVAYPDATPQQCFDTYREAIAVASRGKITDAPVNAKAAMTDKRFLKEMQTFTTQPSTAASSAAGASTLADSSSYVIGATIFGGTSYTGNSLTLYVPKPCAKDGWYDGYFGDLGFMNNDVESVQPWAGCWVWLHDSTDWNGNRMGPYKDQTPDLGDWKNRAVMVGLS